MNASTAQKDGWAKFGAVLANEGGCNWYADDGSPYTKPLSDCAKHIDGTYCKLSNTHTSQTHKMTPSPIQLQI